MLIREKTWDSGFFHLRIGSIAPGTFDALAFEKEKEGFDLVYIFETPASNNNTIISSWCGAPADVKITFEKQPGDKLSLPYAIEEFSDHTPSAELVALALESGIYSRFKTDKRFPAGAFEKLYGEWIRKSTDKTMAEKVLVYKEGGTIAGFVTLERHESSMQIGLVAVDAAYRGKGIGSQLMQAAEFYAQQTKSLSLSIATQAVNREACRLYERCGYEVRDTMNIYHYWNT